MNNSKQEPMSKYETSYNSQVKSRIITNQNYENEEYMDGLSKDHRYALTDRSNDELNNDTTGNVESEFERQQRELIQRRFSKLETDAHNMYNNSLHNAHVESQIDHKKNEELRREGESLDKLTHETKDYLKTHTSPSSLSSFASQPVIGLKGRVHPLYKTSNSQYGAKESSELHQTNQYYGHNGSFTKEFVSGMYKYNGLNTNRTRNSTMKDPSFGHNEYFEPGI